MINTEDDRSKYIYNDMRKVMMHWGFGDACSSIYALLASTGKSMTAEEISAQIGYAYSSVINEVNYLMREGLVERSRESKKYAYTAVVDLLGIIRKERHRLMILLEEMRGALAPEKQGRLEQLVKNINSSLEYLKEVERRHTDGAEGTK